MKAFTLSELTLGLKCMFYYHNTDRLIKNVQHKNNHRVKNNISVIPIFSVSQFHTKQIGLSSCTHLGPI